jgi:prepilin-type N-terminal cleavage/methylation domain-containing protein
MKKRNPRAEAGFTLIELLVVVLIIGILASIAIPQYFKVVERAKVGEAHNFIANLKQSNERYMAREGNYVTAAANLTDLDVTFSGTAPFWGMKNYKVGSLAGSACAGGDPGFKLTLTRDTNNSGVSPRYGGYSILYDRCTGAITYPSCANCTNEFK